MIHLENYEELKKIQTENEYCLVTFLDTAQKESQDFLPEIESCLENFPSLKFYLVEKENGQSIIDGEDITRFPTTTIYQYIYNTIIEKIKIEGKANKDILSDLINGACEKEEENETNKIRTKFHPDPLKKKEDSYFMCHNCFEYYGEGKHTMYYCDINHYYILCEKCKNAEENGEVIEKKKTDKSRHHPQHQLKEKECKGKIMCLSCLEEYDNDEQKQKFYTCDMCEYYLCQKCHDKEEEDKNSE